MTKIQSIYAFVAMVVVIGGAAFGTFKWMDARDDTDEDILEWMNKQELIHEADESFKFQVMDGIKVLKAKTDSSIALGVENQVAIYANRSVIVNQIREDTSLSGEEVYKMLQPLMEGVEDLKKNSGWTP